MSTLAKMKDSKGDVIEVKCVPEAIMFQCIHTYPSFFHNVDEKVNAQLSREDWERFKALGDNLFNMQDM